MSRKIIQISAVAPGGTAFTGFKPAVLALADDGTVWCAGYSDADRNFKPWEKLRDLPQTDQEAVDVLAEYDKPRPSFMDELRKRIAEIRAFLRVGKQR